MVEILFARRDDVNAANAIAASQAAAASAEEAKGWAEGAENWYNYIVPLAEAAEDAATAAQGWADVAEDWAITSKNWSDGAEYWSNQAQGWANGSQGWAEYAEYWSEQAEAAAATLNAGATNLQGGTTGQTLVKDSNADYDFSWSTPAAGGVTSVDVQPTGDGLDTSGGPITSAGTINVFLADDVAALEALSGTGFAVRTAANTWAQRVLTAPAAGFTITNNGGVAGNPTFVLANDLAALEGLASTGFAVRTAADTWAQRTLAAPAAGFTITNANGVSGNPTFVLADDLAAIEALATTGIVRRTGASTWSAGTTIATAEIADNAVTLAKLADIATMTVLGNNTGSTGDPIALSKAQTVALLDAAQLSVTGQALTGGANTDRKYLGNTTGGTNFAIDPGAGPIQMVVNGGAASITPASGKYGICTLIVQNSGGSGAITTTGYTVVGPSFGTTSTTRYACTIVQTQDYSWMFVTVAVA